MMMYRARTHAAANLRHDRPTIVAPKRSTLPMLVSALFSSAVLSLGLHVGIASALSLGEPTLRSFLGEALDVSLPLLSSAENETIDTSCFVLQRVAGDDTYLHGREIKLSVAEIRGSKRLRVQSNNPVSEPVIKLRMRATCGGGTVVRDYALLLDPAPQAPGSIAPPAIIDTPVSTSNTPKPSLVVSNNRSPGVWVAREGDSMKGIATGLFPKNKRNQNRYVAALRNTNPSIAGYAASAPLPPGTNIALPDLRTLPQNSPQPAPLDLPEKPRKSVSSSTASTEKKPTTAKQAVPKESSKTKPDRTTSANKPASKPQTVAKSPGFSLKLSGGDMDISRSAGVTEETRAGMRQKQLLLDADDQVAALLTLSNSVKRLEKRLDAMQGRPAGASAAENAQPNVTGSSTAASALPVTAPTNDTATSAETIAPSAALNTANANTNTEVANSTTTTSASPAKDTKMPAVTAVKKPSTAAPASTSIADDIINNWPLWAGGSVIAAGLAALIWAQRRRKAIKPTYRIEENTLLRTDNAAANQNTTDGLDTVPSAGVEGITVGAGQVASLAARRQSAEALLKPAAPPAGSPTASTLQAPNDEDSDVAFELDVKPVKSSAALQSRGLHSPENRVRRLKYMEERFPELGSGTVSIDDSNSVINAARLYYDEKQADKATELLTFGVEERPQQLALWLALFEVYRLENMAVPFTELATKFHVLFATSPEWPKVRHIGYELNPYEHLFADAVEGVLTGQSPFDSMQDNWLNAPVDMSSHYFAQQLRQSLFSEFNVLPSQLDFSPHVIEAAGS